MTLRKASDPGVNFASVYGLMSVTAHFRFSLPRSNFVGVTPVVKHRVTLLAEGGDTMSKCQKKWLKCQKCQRRS